MAADGRERLTFLPGAVGYPPYSAPLRSDSALVSAARAVRDVHDLSADFRWDPEVAPHGYDSVRPVGIDCIGHGDLAPWNLTFADDEVTGIIDWDSAGPSSRVWDLASLAHHLVPFHPDEDLAAWGWPTPPDRRRRLGLLVDAYGSDLVSASSVVEATASRLVSQGSFVAERARVDDPRFATQTREDHARGYFRAAAHLLSIRESLLG